MWFGSCRGKEEGGGGLIRLQRKIGSLEDDMLDSGEDEWFGFVSSSGSPGNRCYKVRVT